MTKYPMSASFSVLNIITFTADPCHSIVNKIIKMITFTVYQLYLHLLVLVGLEATTQIFYQNLHVISAPRVILIDAPIKTQKEAAKSTLERKWKHHRLRKKQRQGGGRRWRRGSREWVRGTWRCADVWVGVWDDGSGLRSEGGSEGWAGITKVIFPGWYTTTRTTEIREETHRGHPATRGVAEEAIITTLHAFQNKSVK